MKKILLTTMITLLVAGMAVNSYAVETITTHTTPVTATVSSYASFYLVEDDPEGKYRTTTGILTFTEVDGSYTWYYNVLAGLDGNGVPNDDKADVGLGVRANVPFTLKIHKAEDILNGKIGYYVNEAFNWNGLTSESVDTVHQGSGFFPDTSAVDPNPDVWGTVLPAPTLIYDSGTESYADFQMGVAFALVPGNLATGTHLTTITYTMTADL